MLGSLRPPCGSWGLDGASGHSQGRSPQAEAAQRAGACEVSGQSEVWGLARGASAYTSPLPPLPGLGLSGEPVGVTGTVQVDGSFRSEGPGQGVPSGGRVTALLPEAGLMWPPGLLLRLLRPARHSPCPVLSLPSRKARCCRPCPGPLVFLLLLHPQCGPAPHPLTPRGGAPWPMPRVDLHVRRPLCCCSQMDGVAAGQDALGRSPSPACQHSRPVACLSASPPWTGQTQATEPSRPSLAFEGHTEPSSQGSFKP